MRKLLFFIFVFLVAVTAMYFTQDVIEEQGVVKINKDVSDKLDEDMQYLKDRVNKL